MRWTARLLSEADRELFNTFVKKCKKGHILQSWEWGEVKAKTGWEPLRLVVEEKGAVIAAISILKRRLPVVKKSIFYAPRGPVLDIHHQELFDFLLAEVKKLARVHQAVFLKIDPDVPRTDQSFAAYLKKAGFRAADKEVGFEGVQPRFVFRLDITPPEEQLLENLHQKTRYNLRLAKRKGVTVAATENKKDLDVFYRILVETAERDRFLIRSSDYFSVLWDQLVARGYARLFLAKYQGEIIAGTLAFIFGEKTWYIYGASANRHRNVMPNYLLQWHMIRWAKQEGCTLYDFRGVPGNLTEDNPLYGLYRFKKGFNGEYTEFVGEYDLVYLPLFYWAWHRLEPLYSKGIRRLLSLRKKLRGH
ncbi:MAG: peptidoglycan bridge formation glycyltransferase FemA/FemB family protein [Syntrophomonadaceae bacterium]|nr:peptidoglycan bridge formation glycyltransferase FemA/FemB family protein [Syntrophomonadaceae bacterium]